MYIQELKHKLEVLKSDKLKLTEQISEYQTQLKMNQNKMEQQKEALKLITKKHEDFKQKV